MEVTLKKRLNDLKSPQASGPSNVNTLLRAALKDQEHEEEKKSPFEDIPSSNFASAQQPDRIKELKPKVREEYKNDN